MADIQGNSIAFIAGIKKDLTDDLTKKVQDLEPFFNKLLQSSIREMNIPDGNWLNTHSKVEVNNQLQNDGTYEVQYYTTDDVQYAVFVHEGTGTNKRYGRRNYLETAQEQTLQYLKTGTYEHKIMPGSPNKARVNGRKRRRVLKALKGPTFKPKKTKTIKKINRR
jgi:hypothetical protein